MSYFFSNLGWLKHVETLEIMGCMSHFSSNLGWLKHVETLEIMGCMSYFCFHSWMVETCWNPRNNGMNVFFLRTYIFHRDGSTMFQSWMVETCWNHPTDDFLCFLGEWLNHQPVDECFYVCFFSIDEYGWWMNDKWIMDIWWSMADEWNFGWLKPYK